MPLTATQHRVGSLLLLVGLATGLGACSSPDTAPAPTLARDLSDYLFAPVSELPSTDADGNIRVRAVYQDVQRDVDPSSEVVVGDRQGWVIVGLCAPESSAGERLSEVQAAIIPEPLLSDSVRADASNGAFLNALDCADEWTVVP